MNTGDDPEGLVRRGNERVLRARFNDARFFWETDQHKKLADRVADLAKVTFQAKLGSLSGKDRPHDGPGEEIWRRRLAAQRAAQLSKCDLTTELVKEFTELQGVVGGLYARAQGEPEAVWQAIYDHYKPVSMEDSIPRNQAGRLVSLADKLDTLRGCFRIGMIPTGSRDPFALRRAAQGIVKILVEGKLRLPILATLSEQAIAQLQEFLLDRVRYYFKEIRGFKYDEVNAVLASGWDDLVDVEKRQAAVQAVRPTRKLRAAGRQLQAHPEYFAAGPVRGAAERCRRHCSNPGPEADLHAEFSNECGSQRASWTIGRRSKPSLRCGRRWIFFFDKVLVNAPDPDVRQNRLALLNNPAFGILHDCGFF